MTKIRVMSDLHLEFGPLNLEPMNEDVLVLAGDIGIYTDGAVWARDYARRTHIPVVMIAGNHEFYRNNKHRSHTVNSTINALKIIAESEPLLTFLEEDDDVAVIEGVTFIGCTLWTDYALDGNAPLEMVGAACIMNDHRLIWQTQINKFSPENALHRHSFSVARLRAVFGGFNTPVVIVTHHLPSRRSINERYSGNGLSAAYASNLDDLVEASNAALWIHGHTHSSCDYMIGNTRVLCNPRGYAGHEVNPDFDPTLVVSV